MCITNKTATEAFIQYYFGQTKDLIGAAINRAYADMASHTLRIDSQEDKKKCKEDAAKKIRHGLEKYDGEKDILRYVETEDIRRFGMIPEFIGRLPVVFTLQPMTKEMLIRVLKEPKNAIVKQYKQLLKMDRVELEFSDDAYEAIAEKAMKKDTGARGLRSILEEFMLDIMFEIPNDPDIGKVVITREYIEGTGGPVIELRGQP